MNEYKKYTISTFSLITIFIILSSIYNCFWGKDSGASLWIEMLYNKKLEYARGIKQPKIVIVGGSNALFSIKAAEIEKELNIPVVNAGTHAGLGLVYLLYKAKEDFLKSNDTVLLSIEYKLFKNDMDNEEVLINYVKTFDREYFNTISLNEKIKGLTEKSLKNPLNLLKIKTQQNAINSEDLTEATYNPENINIHGDQLKAVGQLTELFNKRNELQEDLKENLNVKNYPVKKIEEFLNWCDGNNINVIYTFPSLPYYEEYDSAQYQRLRRDLEEFFKQRNVPVLNTEDVYYLDNKYFYDTVYHLNTEGRKVRTQAVIRELKKLELFNKKNN